MQTGNQTYQDFARPVGILDADPAVLEQTGGDMDAVLLTQALRTAQNAPDTREDKIAEIRSRLDADAYVIDSTRIACAIIREEPGLFVR